MNSRYVVAVGMLLGTLVAVPSWALQLAPHLEVPRELTGWEPVGCRDVSAQDPASPRLGKRASRSIGDSR